MLCPPGGLPVPELIIAVLIIKGGLPIGEDIAGWLHTPQMAGAARNGQVTRGCLSVPPLHAAFQSAIPEQ